MHNRCKRQLRTRYRFWARGTVGVYECFAKPRKADFANLLATDCGKPQSAGSNSGGATTIPGLYLSCASGVSVVTEASPHRRIHGPRSPVRLNACGPRINKQESLVPF